MIGRKLPRVEGFGGRFLGPTLVGFGLGGKAEMYDRLTVEFTGDNG